jgi:hypothetical protein
MDASILKTIRLALEVISDRLITILTLVMGCSLACWAMWGPSWERVVTLVIFTIFGYALGRAKEKPNDSKDQSV